MAVVYGGSQLFPRRIYTSAPSFPGMTTGIAANDNARRSRRQQQQYLRPEGRVSSTRRASPLIRHDRL